MGTTRDFNETVRADLQNSAEYRRAYLREAVGCVVSGDVETGKSVLRKYINGTLGFVALGSAVGRSSKTLMQMLSANGNPTIANFFEIVSYLQKLEGSALQVVDAPKPRSSRQHPARSKRQTSTLSVARSRAA
jgi:DNA-binding phage protein